MAASSLIIPSTSGLTAVGPHSQEWAAPIGLTAGLGGSNDLLYYVPLLLAAGTLDRIGIELTLAGSASSVCRLGIYRDSGAGYPGALLLDAGTVATNGSPAALTITISQAVDRALYWLAAGTQGASSAPNYRGITGQSYLMTQTGLSNVAATARTQSGVSGALPSVAAPTAIVGPALRPGVRYQ